MYRSDGSVKEQGYWGGGVLEESRSLEHCASGDCLNGKGTKYYVDGSRYEGDFVNGGRNGWGIFFSARGLPMYEGQWNSMGRYHGTGTQFYEDGAVNYKGDWDNNFRHGVGTLYSQDGGISYQGGWDKNTIHGSGKLFKNGKLTYEGGFFKGEKHGYGVSINADGTRYEGDWYFGEKSGRGTFYYADGNRYEGEVDLGEATGAGVFYYADGRRFVGEVDRNTRSGKGTLYREDGSVSKQGIWLDDNFVQAMVLDDTAQPVKQQAPQVELDSQPPEITMQRGVNVVAKALHTVKGKATDTSGVAIVEVNGKEASLDADGNFSVDILLAPGTNEVIIAATDTLENTGYRKYSITREANAPIATPKATPLLSRTLTTGDYYALLIGVNEYESSTINDLVEPVKDTEKLGQVLVDNYSFEADNVSQLINPTHDEILDELDGLAERLTQDDNLLIFYAGHGYWDESREEGYWLPSDADQNRTRAWISNRTIVSAIKGIKTQHTLLISDACFSGGIFKTRSAFNDIPPATEALYDLPSRKAMTSGTLTEVPDKSVFIEYLIKRLENNDNKYSTSQEIFASMRTAVINNSPTEQVPQFGEIRNTGDEGGDFIFVRR